MIGCCFNLPPLLQKTTGGTVVEITASKKQEKIRVFPVGFSFFIVFFYQTWTWTWIEIIIRSIRTTTGIVKSFVERTFDTDTRWSTINRITNT